MTQLPEPPSDNPYVGPYTFQREQRDRFFGRDLEARELLALVLADRLVLFYAQSGAGKSSLINTRLIPDLEENGFEVLPVGRVGGATRPDVDNPFVYHFMASLLRRSEEEVPRELASLPLSTFLMGLDKDDGGYHYDAGAEETRDGGVAGSESEVATADESPVEIWPRALLIDQFEEIFTTNLQAWRKRADFFVQLRQAMEDDPYLWVVLTLREDYVAGLDPYAHLLPGGIRTRYYMQRLSTQAAFDAITKPAKNARRPLLL